MLKSRSNFMFAYHIICHYSMYCLLGSGDIKKYILAKTILLYAWARRTYLEFILYFIQCKRSTIMHSFYMVCVNNILRGLYVQTGAARLHQTKPRPLVGRFYSELQAVLFLVMCGRVPPTNLR